MIKKIVLAAVAILLLAAAPAQAQNEWPSPTAGKAMVGVVGTCLNSAGKAVPLVDANGVWQCAGQFATGAAGQTADTPTVQNAAYASGNCVGGFRSVAVASHNGQSGWLTNFRVSSIGGAIPTLTLYLFDANPSASTCTDKGTFTLATADVDKLISNPTTSVLTLAAPTGTTITSGSVDYSPPRPFVAGGSSASGVKTIYYAIVSGSTFTPASTTDLHIRIGAALN